MIPTNLHHLVNQRSIILSARLSFSSLSPRPKNQSLYLLSALPFSSLYSSLFSFKSFFHPLPRLQINLILILGKKNSISCSESHPYNFSFLTTSLARTSNFRSFPCLSFPCHVIQFHALP